jgi:uncharacterized repeat protein (TIGR04076 family)
MFQIKATVIDFKGDIKNFPCHFGFKIGDEIIFDGERLIGRVCPQILPLLSQRIQVLHSAGPRYFDPMSYGLWRYEVPSVRDNKFKKYDGLGYRVVKGPFDEPQDYLLAKRLGPNARKYPPAERNDIKGVMVFTCNDFKTGTTMRLEAFDLSGKGFSQPYFRKQMLILDKVLEKPNIKVNKIRSEFNREQVEDIFPGLFPAIFELMIDELQAIGYLDINNGNANITERGKVKLKDFVEGLPEEDREALGI